MPRSDLSARARTLGIDVSSFHVATCSILPGRPTVDAETWRLPDGKGVTAFARSRAIESMPSLRSKLLGPSSGWDAVYVEIPGGKHLLAHVAISYVVGALGQYIDGPVTLLRPAEWRKELWGADANGLRRAAAKRKAMDEADRYEVAYSSDDEAEAFCLALLAARWIEKHSKGEDR